MEKRMTHKLVAALLGFSFIGPPSAQAAEDSVATSTAFLAEVRLLRQAIERQSVLAGRAQLLVGRLGIQDQRVARWQAEVQKLEGEAAALSAEMPRLQSALSRVRANLEQAKDADQTAGMEHEILAIDEQIRERRASVQVLETRRDEARRVLDTERARYDELNERLDQMERETMRPTR
jgi:chromosome segregation ATPase